MKLLDLLLAEQSSHDPFAEEPDEQHEYGSKQHIAALRKRYQQLKEIEEMYRQRWTKAIQAINADGNIVQRENPDGGVASGMTKMSIDERRKLKAGHLFFDYEHCRLCPNTQYYKTLIKRSSRMSKKVDEYMRLSRDAKKRLEDARQNVLTKANKEKIASSTFTEIPSTTKGSIPQKLPAAFGLEPTLKNPYWMSSQMHSDYRYAGEVDKYDFSKKYADHYWSMESAFQRNGIPGFTIMFAGAHNSTKGFFTNFVAYAVDGQFMWRKTDYGGGSAITYIYIRGVKMSNDFQFAKPAEQDELLRGYFPEYFK